MLVDLQRQTDQSSEEEEQLNSAGGRVVSMLTAFTSNANSTCCRSGDTWYLAALDLSWVGRKGAAANATSKREEREDVRGDTHKQLVGHDDGAALRLRVKLHHVSVPAAIQQLGVCGREIMSPWWSVRWAAALTTNTVPSFDV